LSSLSVTFRLGFSTPNYKLLSFYLGCCSDDDDDDDDDDVDEDDKEKFKVIPLHDMKALGTRWRSLLRQCTTSLKIACSISDWEFENFPLI
jgi:hypothetical protein